MDSLNWGKCVLAVFWQYPDDTKRSLHFFPIAAEDTTELSTEEGTEVEATIEGGEVEAVRYTANKYNLAAAIRTLSTRKKPLKDDNGRVVGQGGVLLIPENIETDYALWIENAQAKVVDSFTSADGGRYLYNFKALKATSGNQVKWGKINVVGTSASTIEALIAAKDSINSFGFDEIQTEGEDAPASATIWTKTS